MANVKISDLPAATSMATADVIVANQSGTTKRSTLELLIDLIEATGLTFTVTQAFAAITGTSITLTADALANGVKLNALPAGYRNGTIDASAASNAITITYETQASATPSATDPVSMVHRSATITSGVTTIRNQTAALTLTIPSGATGGCASSEAVRWHIIGVLNAATAMELAVFTAAVTASTSIKRFDPTALVTTTAIGAGSDSAQTIYSTSARTDQPAVYLGYIEATSGVTAGQWSAIDKIVNWEPGVPMPGDVVNEVKTYFPDAASGTTTMPADNTKPQITEGDQYMTQAITAKSIMNRVEVEFKVTFTHSIANAGVNSALFQDATADALKTQVGGPLPQADASGQGNSLVYEGRVGTVSATTFKVRAGSPTAGTARFNSTSVGGQFDGTFDSFIGIKEIHV